MKQNSGKGIFIPLHVLIGVLVCFGVIIAVLAVRPFAGRASGGMSSEMACCTSSSAAGTASAASTAVCSMPGMGGTASASSESGDSCDFGTVDILTVSTGSAGLSEFQSIAGKQNHTATFEKTDAGGNVLYSWTFKGTDVKTPANVDMNIDISTSGALADTVAQVVSGYGGQQVKSGVYLQLNQTGALPGKATVMVAANGQFAANAGVNVYAYDEDKGNVTQVASAVRPVSGYLSFTVSRAADYVLTTQTLDIPFWSKVETWQVLVCAAAVGAAAGILVPLLLRRRRVRAAKRQG